MIRYTLNCAAGHRFESWFPSSASYDAQRGRGLVTCPTCGSGEVEKAMMAPSVARTDIPRTDLPAPDGTPDSAPAQTPAQTPAESPAAAPAMPMMAQPEGELRALLRQLREHVVKTSDDVGEDFAALARKMHDGELEHRSIYGEATVEEVKALKEDEVEVFPLPVLPEERN